MIHGMRLGADGINGFPFAKGIPSNHLPHARSAGDRTTRGARGRVIVAATALGLMLSLALSGCVAKDVTSRPSPSKHLQTAAVDHGPTENARGAATRLTPMQYTADQHFQRPYRYTVAKGDTLLGIDHRFSVCSEDITAINPGVVDVNLQIGQALTIARTEDTAPTTCSN